MLHSIAAGEFYRNAAIHRNVGPRPSKANNNTSLMFPATPETLSSAIAQTVENATAHYAQDTNGGTATYERQWQVTRNCAYFGHKKKQYLLF